MDETNIIICENCYEENESTRTICKRCGSKLYHNSAIKQYNSTKKDSQFETEEEARRLSQEYNKEKNKVATIIKAIAIIIAIICSVAGLVTISELEMLSIAIIIAGFISMAFVYALGEIIQLLEDIKNK